MHWGNLRLADVLALPPYDHARVTAEAGGLFRIVETDELLTSV